MDEDVRKWLASRADTFLRNAGLAEGQHVLDFGCNKGTYAAAAARVVGQTGKVYALDKETDALQEVEKVSRHEGLGNVECLQVPEGGRVPLADNSVDAVLLYDVLHRGYFPESVARAEALGSIWRVLRTMGLLSLYPTHLKKYGMTFQRVLLEVEAAGFKLKGESRHRLIHDGHLTRGRVFTFEKSEGPGVFSAMQSAPRKQIGFPAAINSARRG